MRALSVSTKLSVRIASSSASAENEVLQDAWFVRHLPH